MKKILYLAVLVFSLVLFNGCDTQNYNLFCTLYGTITDHETGEPINAASVVLSPGGKTKTTGTDGRFEFDDLDAGQYTISVQKVGYRTNRKTVTTIMDKDTEVNIPLTKNE